MSRFVRAGTSVGRPALVAALVLLVGLKTLIDLVLHLREHRSRGSVTA